MLDGVTAQDVISFGSFGERLGFKLKSHRDGVFFVNGLDKKNSIFCKYNKTTLLLQVLEYISQLDLIRGSVIFQNFVV
jgi:hypothetical protein